MINNFIHTCQYLSKQHDNKIEQAAAKGPTSSSSESVDQNVLANTRDRLYET